MSVIGAHINTLIALHVLEANPDISLDMLKHMADVNRAICIGERAGDKDVAFRHDGPGASVFKGG
jgi:hypothetical protein